MPNEDLARIPKPLRNQDEVQNDICPDKYLGRAAVHYMKILAIIAVNILGFVIFLDMSPDMALELLKRVVVIYFCVHYVAINLLYLLIWDKKYYMFNVPTKGIYYKVLWIILAPLWGFFLISYLRYRKDLKASEKS